MSLIGFDIGTGNLVCAKSIRENKSVIKSMRNMFLPISPDDLSVTEISNTQLDYVELTESDGSLQTIAIIGEDAFRFANIFNQKVRRPMSCGIISSSELDAVDIMGHMIKFLIDETNDISNNFCVYSVPAQPIDLTDVAPVTYHEKVFSKVFSSLGYENKPFNEGMSVVYSNCKNENYSGIGISFGAGLTNVACCYKGALALSFSIGVAGDWIDKNVSLATGKLQTRVTSIKEKLLDLSNVDSLKEGKKEEQRIKQSLYTFYEEMIRYVLKMISKEFNSRSDNLSVDESIPIVLSGGTSMAKGFTELFKKVFYENHEKDFPYSISEIRSAKDPLNSVAIGCLEYCLLIKSK